MSELFFAVVGHDTLFKWVIVKWQSVKDLERLLVRGPRTLAFCQAVVDRLDLSLALGPWLGPGSEPRFTLRAQKELNDLVAGALFDCLDFIKLGDE